MEGEKKEEAGERRGRVRILRPMTCQRVYCAWFEVEGEELSPFYTCEISVEKENKDTNLCRGIGQPRSCLEGRRIARVEVEMFSVEEGNVSW